MAISDRNPAVSGTTNTTITTAAGKDLASALVAGLLTIGPRFGGVVEESARMFAEAYDADLPPQEFITAMEQRGMRIPGIGSPSHTVRYCQRRVAILREYAHANFVATDLLDYALAVEKITQRKHPGLVLNIDGCVGVTLLDLLRSCGAFSEAEADEHVHMGLLTGLFLLGRSIDFMGRFIDLQRLKSVAFVAHAPLLAPEMRDMIARNTNGLHAGLVRGGESASDETLLEQVLRYQADPQIKLIALVVPPDRNDKQALMQAIEQRRITRPLLVCTGASAGPTKGAPGRAQILHNADTSVPERLAEFGAVMCQTYRRLAIEGVLSAHPQTSGQVEDGEHVLYAGMPIETVFAQHLGIGGVLGLIWFKRQLPVYARRFIEMVLMAIADHGPAVPGAHNTIVAVRADKDLVSALASGLLTVGPRFGGAIDDAARGFARAYDAGLSPDVFVTEMKQRGELIIGIGHRVRSLQNPDQRVALLKAFARKHFPATDLLDFALAVEQITTSRRSNLILNIDGCIAVCFVDMLRSCGAFLPEEADMYVQMGFLNGLFMLGRSIGLIGHYLDQKRLRQGLYHHPWDDIAYMLPEDVPTFE